MLATTTWLTLATLAGLVAGFGREWLLLADWGAGPRTDAFLVAMFLPEAVRMSLAAGLLNSAALPLYQARDGAQQRAWLSAQSVHLLGLGLLLALLLGLGADLWCRAIGPGQSSAGMASASHSLRILAWCIPGICLQAVLVIPHQAQSRYVLAGLGSLFYNLPAVLVLAIERHRVSESMLAWAFVAGSVWMSLILLPLPWRQGWRPWQRAPLRAPIGELQRQIAPLLVSAGASQALAWLERVCASYLGAGSISIVNFARKLNNLPLVALMSLNQILLSRMGRADSASGRTAVLLQGLRLSSWLTVPTAAGMILVAPALVALLPGQIDPHRTAVLLAWMAAALVFGGWNAMLARYAYAHHDTRGPTLCELQGSAVNALALIALPAVLGLKAIAIAGLLGAIVTGILLARRLRITAAAGLGQQWLVAALVLLGSGWLAALLPASQIETWLRAIAVGIGGLLGYALWLRPWRGPGTDR